MTYTVGSLFSGAGGLDMGVQMALGPADLRWVSDVEPGPCALLAHHWPKVPNLGDITTVDWTRVEPVDVIAGGSPCQDLSLAGARKGMKSGTRSGLWESMFHAIRTIRPHLVVWENVRGAYSADAFSLMESREGRVGGGADGPVLRALGRVLGDLASVGYDAIWTGVRASDVGAPHQRYRVFVAAHPAGDTWWLEQRGTLDAADTESIGLERFWSARGRGDGSADSGESPVVLLPTPTAERYGSNQSPSEGAAVRYGLDAIGKLLPTPMANEGEKAAFAPRNDDRQEYLTNTIARLLPTPRASDGEKSGPNQHGSRGDLTMPSACQPQRFGDYAPAIHRWEQALRPAPDPTEPNGRGGRRLSARFVEWMQGMPDGHVTGIGLTRVQQLRILGNIVVPQQAAHALRLMRDEERAMEGEAA